MQSETLLWALRERMRKLTDARSAHAVRDAELRAAVERVRMTEAAEAAQEAAALAESQQLADEIRALPDHIDNLVRGRERSRPC